MKTNTSKNIFYQQQQCKRDEDKQWSADLDIGSSGRSTSSGRGNLPDKAWSLLLEILPCNIFALGRQLEYNVYTKSYHITFCE